MIHKRSWAPAPWVPLVFLLPLQFVTTGLLFWAAYKARLRR